MINIVKARKGKTAGENHPMFGKHHTEESRRKMSENVTKAFKNPETIRKMSVAKLGKTNTPNSKPVLQYTIDGKFVNEFPSAREVTRQYGFSFKCISACCLGSKKTAYNYIWKFKN